MSVCDVKPCAENRCAKAVKLVGTVNPGSILANSLQASRHCEAGQIKYRFAWSLCLKNARMFKIKSKKN